MTDNLRPKWMDGPGDDEIVDYDRVRDWARKTDRDLSESAYADPPALRTLYALRTLCRELLRVNEALMHALHRESSQ